MGSTQNHSWTDERVELLKKLWGDGLSKSVIAHRLGGVTANAVIGKVHRLELPARANTASSEPRQQKPRVGSTHDAALIRYRIEARRKPPKRYPNQGKKADAPASSDIPVPGSLNVPLLELEDQMCHAPTGKGLYCGRTTENKRAQYCEYHTRDTHQPTKRLNPRYGTF